MPAFDGERAVELGIRPEHLRITTVDGAQIVGRASVVEYLGNTSYAYVDTPQGTLIVEASGQNLPHSGDGLGLSLSGQDAHVFDETGAAWPALAP
jgi:ABC-type sugar transport system ATPase subunit